MENSIYIGLSKQMVLRTNMDIVSNNVANMNTPGFRAQNLLFSEFLDKHRRTGEPGADDPLSFVYDQGQYENTSPGPVSQTGNALDVAVIGPGFMGVQGPDGQTVYTRAGDFQLGAGGVLLSSAGYPIVDQGGGPITIPEGSGPVSIDNKGVISGKGGQLAQLMLVEFDNTQELEPVGHNTYRTDAAPLPTQNSTIKQGHLEGSNVQPVIEITRMIDTLRSFQSVNNVLQSENERLRTAIQRLTRPA